MPTLYDHRGNPIRSSSLEERPIEERRGPFASPLRDSVVNWITPTKMARLFRAADDGDAQAYLTLAEEIEERDCHYRSVLFQRRAAVSQLTPEVEAVDDSDEEQALAAAVRGLVEAPEFADLLFEMLDALGKSYSVVRIVWETADGMWRPSGYRWTDPRYFEVDRETLRVLRIRDGSPTGEPINAANYIVHLPKLKSGVTLRNGLARPAALAWMFKSYTVRDLARFLEVYGIPARIGKYPTGTSREDRAKLFRAAKMLGTDAAGIIPTDMSIEFMDSQRGTEAAAFLGTAEYWDRQVSKVVLGQTSSVEGSGGDYKASGQHKGVRMEIAAHDARQAMATTCTQLIRNFVAFNFGHRKRYPRCYLPVPVPADLTKFAAALAPMIDRGLRVTARDVRETFGLGAPQDGDELLSARALPTMPQAGPAGDTPGGTDSVDDPNPAAA